MSRIIDGGNCDNLINNPVEKKRWERKIHNYKSRAINIISGFNPARTLFIAIALVMCLPGKSQAQTDSLKRNTLENIIWYFDIGFGSNTRGLNLDMSFTVSSAKVLGGSLNFMSGFVKLKDVPADYYDGLFRWSTPVNSFWDLSLNLTVKFSSPDKPFRFGLEAGPSFIHYDMIELKINPDYPDLFEYKYDKIHTIHNNTGFYCAMKAEVPALDFLGCSFILFGNINAVQSLFGLDICISLGKVRKS